MFVVGATIAVDTFFVIGGLVTVYTFLKATDKGVKFNIVLYYVHRYMRWVDLVLQNNEISKIEKNLLVVAYWSKSNRTGTAHFTTIFI